HPRIQDLQKKLSEKTKAVVTISPNNPTGAVYSADELKKINEFCASHDLFHISDEVYEYFVYDPVAHKTALIFDDDLDHTISLFSFSKAFGMSGLRVGYMVVPQHIYDDVLKVQDTIGICAPAISQLAAEAAIQMDDRYVSRFLPVFQKNREVIRDLLSPQSKVKYSMHNGAYYIFLSYDNTLSSWELTKQLVEEYKVMVLPGSVFDREYSLRVSYGNLKTKDFEKGLYRLVDGLNDIL
ncbi:MAG: aminotransferase class I/II-fold pyridoxal phosphate-dependent enzyme, partial [Thermoplasmatota archaeon]